WMPGIDTGDRERRRIEPRALERLYVEVVGRAAPEYAIAVHVDEHHRYLEQGVGRDIEAARLHIDCDRQVAAKTPRHESRRGSICGGERGGQRITHAPIVTQRPLTRRAAMPCAHLRATARARLCRKDNARVRPRAPAGA